MVILLVGQSLPKGSPADAAPFDGTLSGKRLARWLQILQVPAGATTRTINACHKKGAAKATVRDIQVLKLQMTRINPDKVIALGAVAAAALQRAGVECWQLPHPNGKNLRLNDARRLANDLEECRKWLVDAPFGYPFPVHRKNEEE